jgi:hypothetical protein
MKTTRFGLIAATCMIFVVQAVSQGLYFETTRSSGKVEKFWYMPGKFKDVDSDGRTFIALLDKETFYDIRPETRTYTEMTFADMKKMYDTGHSMLTAMMQKRLESLPPDKRKELEDRMSAYQTGTAAGAKYEVTGTGESKTISGYPCSKYIVKKNGKEFETVWATRALGDMDAVHRDMEQLSQKLASAMNTRSAPLEWFKQIPGFPIQNDIDGTVSTVSHVEKRDVSASEFSVPSGYTKEEPEGLEKMEQ